jgi:hypothetical protein
MCGLYLVVSYLLYFCKLHAPDKYFSGYATLIDYTFFLAKLWIVTAYVTTTITNTATAIVPVYATNAYGGVEI